MKTTTFVRQLRDLTANYLLDLLDPEGAEPDPEDEPQTYHIYQDLNGDLLFLKSEEEVRLAYEADLAFVEEYMEEHDEAPDNVDEVTGRKRPVFVLGVPAIRHIIAIAQGHDKDQDLALMEVMANVDWSAVDLQDADE